MVPTHSVRSALTGAMRLILARCWILAGKEGYSDGVSCEALFNNPWHIVIDQAPSGYTLVVSDMGNHCIRRITTSGSVTTLAGVGGQHGYLDGQHDEALFTLPCGLACDESRNIYVSDSGNHVIRVVRSDGHVNTVAGQAGYHGLVDGAAHIARFYSPRGIEFDLVRRCLYVADLANHAIRHVCLVRGLVSTMAGGGCWDGVGKGLAAAAGHLDGVGVSARFKGPADVALDGGLFMFGCLCVSVCVCARVRGRVCRACCYALA